MRKTILSSAAALALGLAAASGPATAQDLGLERLGFFEFSPGEFTPGSELDATVEFDKRILVLEAVRKVKLVLVRVGNTYEFGRGAESIVVVHQSTTGLTVDTNNPAQNEDFVEMLDLRPFPGFPNILVHHQLTATIADSLNGNQGIVQFNEDTGNGNNQGNTFSAAVAFNAQFAESMASAQQTTANNTLDSATPGWATARFATIRDSANRNSGVLMVNQSSGHGGNQLNAVSIAIGKDGAEVALSEADLGQFNTNNVVNDTNSHRRGLITGSFNGNQGIALGTQSTGNFNNQATVISIAGTVR